jgi:hypothetical protein
MSTEIVNDDLVLISGPSATGKSASLMNIANPEGVMYLNCESNKKLPFKSKFMELTIIDPYQVYEAFDHAETMSNIHTIIIDTSTYLMDMYETQYVLASANTQKAWGDYAQYFKRLMQHYVAKSTKNVIVLAHTKQVLNDAEMVLETKVPVKGALSNNGIESYFSTVISCKKMPLNKLKDFQSDLLTITEEEEMLGYKHVFQTRLTKDTVNERIRSSMGMWNIKETYIDNNAQLVIDKLHQFYKV